jgi:hypothetical protein
MSGAGEAPALPARVSVRRVDDGVVLEMDRAPAVEGILQGLYEAQRWHPTREESREPALRVFEALEAQRGAISEQEWLKKPRPSRIYQRILEALEGTSEPQEAA